MKKIFFLFILIAALFSSCKTNTHAQFKEGLIEYEISYPPESTQDKMLAAMMPSKMTMYFKNNLTKADLSAGMGIMNISLISDHDQKKLTTLLKIVDKKYALILDSINVSAQIERKGNWKIEKSNDTKIIAGYTCKKATARDDKHNRIITLYYTNEIDIANSNWGNQYHDIDGVLMEYELILNNIKMKMTATKVEGTTINPSIYTIPDSYPIVTKEEMPEIFTQFFE